MWEEVWEGDLVENLEKFLRKMGWAKGMCVGVWEEVWEGM